VSKPVYRCPSCLRRVKRAPSISLTDRRTRREMRYHGNITGCLRTAVLEAQRRGPEEIVLTFSHTRRCGNAAGKLSCRGGCFAALWELEDVLLSTSSPDEAKIVKIGVE
jgi:hypothetical protein